MRPLNSCQEGQTHGQAVLRKGSDYYGLKTYGYFFVNWAIHVYLCIEDILLIIQMKSNIRVRSMY